MAETHEIIWERMGDVGLMKISNPPQNYIKKPDLINIQELEEFVSSGIKALVITGAGRHFSAGADIETVKEQIKDKKCFTEQLIRGNYVLNYLDEMDIPVIAAITGVCFGAGFEIALSCDIRICDPDTLFAFPEINQGVFPGLGGITRLSALTGKPVAMELVMHGDLINVEKAKELGIVDKISDKKRALEKAVSLAKKMTDNRQLSVIKAIMTSIKNSKMMSMEEAVRMDAEMFTRLVEKSLEKE
jgi:enoyl-CoA hydratase